MLRHLWLIFAQTVTVCIAVWFVVATLKPDWLALRPVATTSSQAGSSTVTVAQAAAPPLGALDLAKGGSGSYSEAAKKAMPAVVNIFTAKEVKSPRHPFLNDPLFRHFFGRELNQQQQSRRASSLGSGVIVSPEGYVLTNHHVIESADEIEVLLSDGRRASAKVVGSDPETDLAVVKVDLKGLPSIVFGRPENAKVGDVVLAIGNPFGVGQTVTMGIVSALGRSHLGINTFENFIQTDAAINPGNSGGALVDSQGNLLGVNTAIYSRSGGSLGIGFAIPSNMAKSIMEQIIATGGVTRGWIGVEIQEITPDLAESFKLPKNQGAIIAGVMKGGPADKGGIKPGDVLLEIDGKPVTDSSTMLNVIAQLAPGSAAQMKVLRDSKPQDLSVTVGKRPKPTPQQQRQQRQQQEEDDE
jgi:serine protease DegQ